MNLVKRSVYFCLAALLLAFAACNDKNDNKSKPVSNKTPGDMEKMTIRYIDEDSIMANYNLAKDINERMLAAQNDLDNAQKQRSAAINQFGATMEQKYKNNGYLSEESFKADQDRLMKMQNDAQSYLAGKEREMTNALQQMQIQLMDSLNNFLTDYAKQKGYDMVLRKSATLYIDPAYDVTEEVIEGLNKRYNKVSSGKGPVKPDASSEKNAPKVSLPSSSLPSTDSLGRK